MGVYFADTGLAQRPQFLGSFVPTVAPGTKIESSCTTLRIPKRLQDTSSPSSRKAQPDAPKSTLSGPGSLDSLKNWSPWLHFGSSEKF